jgi:hypothetical protein
MSTFHFPEGMTFETLLPYVADLIDRVEALEAKKPKKPRQAKLPAIIFDKSSGKWGGLTDAQWDAWISDTEKMLHVNVNLELNKAAVWLKNHPERHPADCRRFLTNWMLKASRIQG